MRREELIKEIKMITRSMERIVKLLEEEAAEIPDKTSPAKAELPIKNEVNEKDITQLLKRMGIPAHIGGYSYLRTGVMMTLEDPELRGAITKALYPKIAKKYNVTASKVERAIRHAIEVSMSRIDYEFYLKVFENTVSPDKGKPTNRQYILSLVDYLVLNKNK